jgi:hypothetical protein
VASDRRPRDLSEPLGSAGCTDLLVRPCSSPRRTLAGKLAVEPLDKGCQSSEGWPVTPEIHSVDANFAVHLLHFDRAPINRGVRAAGTAAQTDVAKPDQPSIGSVEA